MQTVLNNIRVMHSTQEQLCPWIIHLHKCIQAVTVVNITPQ